MGRLLGDKKLRETFSKHKYGSEDRDMNTIEGVRQFAGVSINDRMSNVCVKKTMYRTKIERCKCIETQASARLDSFPTMIKEENRKRDNRRRPRPRSMELTKTKT